MSDGRHVPMLVLTDKNPALDAFKKCKEIVATTSRRAQDHVPETRLLQAEDGSALRVLQKNEGEEVLGLVKPLDGLASYPKLLEQLQKLDGDAINAFLKDFEGNPALLNTFNANPKLVDSWKVLKEGSLDDVLRKNINILEQINLALKGEFGITISKANNRISVKAANGDELIRLEGNQSKIGKHSINANPNNISIKNVDEINNSYPAGWEAPYDKNMPPLEFKTVSSEQFVRVFTQDVNTPNGSWIMKKSDIEGLTPAQIKDRFAIPGSELPNRIVDVHIPAETRLRTGKAASTSGGSGGGLQFEIPFPDSRPNTWFINERPL